jgi:hypothetical protein
MSRRAPLAARPPAGLAGLDELANQAVTPIAVLLRQQSRLIEQQYARLAQQNDFATSAVSAVVVTEWSSDVIDLPQQRALIEQQ